MEPELAMLMQSKPSLAKKMKKLKYRKATEACDFLHLSSEPLMMELLSK